jgi:hypothetical protein
MFLQFLNHLCLLVEELALAFILDFTCLVHLFVAALETSKYALNHNAIALDLMELPFNFKHAPVGLDANCSSSLFLTMLLRFTTE